MLWISVVRGLFQSCQEDGWLAFVHEVHDFRPKEVGCLMHGAHGEEAHDGSFVCEGGEELFDHLGFWCGWWRW